MHQNSANPLSWDNIVPQNQSTAVLLLDQALNVVDINSAAEQLIFASASKQCGRPLADVARFPDELESRLANHVDGQQQEHHIAMWLPHKQLEVMVDCTITSGSIADGTSGGNGWHILEIVEAGSQFRQERERELETQQRAANTLIREIAHEIKNPLGGLRGAAQLLSAELGDNGLRDYTNIIVGEADRLHALIGRLLGPNQQPKFSFVNVHEALEYVRQLLSTQKDTAAIERDYDPSIPELWGERDWLVQIFLNIAQNAAVAAGRSGKVTFKTRVERQFSIRGNLHRHVISIQMIDSGPGIPEEIRETLFYPLVSGRPEGNGIGLSIAQRLAHKLNGMIEFESRTGHTVFSMFLPLMSAEELEHLDV
ncbi:MAG: nitrogen regulation protein NR(II) [Pseudomonadota bacterium]